MKKKILAFCLLITILCTFLFGCNLFGTNSEKDLQRVIASVGDKDYKDEIKKYELVNYYVSVYNQQYSQSGSANIDVESLLDEMIYNRIKIQEAINYLLTEFYDKNTVISDYIKQHGFTYYEILGRSDIYDKDNFDTENEFKNYAYRQVIINIKPERMTIKDILSPEGEVKTSQFLTMLLRVYYGNIDNAKLDEISSYSFEEYYNALKESKKESKIFSDHLAITAFNSVWASEKSSLDEIENQLRKDRGIDEIEQEDTSTDTKRVVPAKGKENTFVLPNANRIINSEEDALRGEAKKKYEKQIKKNLFNMTYEEFLEKQLVSELEQKVVNRHQELVVENYPETEPDKFNKLFEERYNAIFNSEKQNFDLSLNDYKTKLQSLGDDTFILYNPDSGVYGYVKHILLGVDTDLNKHLKKELDILKTKEMTRSVYLKEREKILNKTQIKDLRENLKVGENNENIFQDYPDFEDTKYSVLEIYNKFKTQFSDLSSSSDLEGIFQAKTSMLANNSEELLKYFDQWIFMYNTDSGMFNNSVDYLLTEMGSMNSGETYMPEFAKASRDLIKLAYENNKVGYYTITATDYGYHIILCSDIIIPTNPDEGLFDAVKLDYEGIVSRIKNKTETTADKATAVYKLYMIMRNEYGQNAYETELIKIINEYYNGKVEFFKSSYADLLKL